MSALVLAVVLAASGDVATTSSAIAIANLDAQIARRADEPGVADLLLMRARFFGDSDALDRAVVIAETAGDLLQRARVRAALHRFDDALADVEAAESAGANDTALRASILVALGHAGEVIPQLEAQVVRDPGFTSRSALAIAYAATGRFTDADRAWVAALDDLGSTSPFPRAWVHFARGVMWAEQAGDPARGEALYRQALVHLPEFVAANVHLAELETARGDLEPAVARLERVVASTHEPEALALLGRLHVRTGDWVRGREEIACARARFEALLVRHPQAFAHHAELFRAMEDDE